MITGTFFSAERPKQLFKNIPALILALGISVSAAYAVHIDSLAGPLPPAIQNNGGCYLVTGDIIVVPGSTVTIDPGVVFLFKDFTGMQIHGTLLARGTSENPVVFTSKNDRHYARLDSVEAAPFDWNGLTVDGSGMGTVLEHCIISYSLFGINSLTEYITLSQCRFIQNGKSDLSVMGLKIPMVAQPFSYASHAASSDTHVLTNPLVLAPRHPSSGRTAFRVTSSFAFLGGLVFGVLKTSAYLESRKRFTQLNNSNDKKNLMDPAIQQEWDAAKNADNRDGAEMWAGYGFAFAGLLSFTVSFYF
ncbi:MAG: hypothetical protein PHC61_07785 [Chitinivibrionales bacterium]|nr:hypothetical protein [Chitinivibrionales bacterium]